MNASAARPAPAAVVVGTSAGGVEALKQLLPALPPDLAVPVVIVQHIPNGTPSLLVEVFAPLCRVAVHDVDDKSELAPGVWFAPPGYHVLVDGPRQLSLSVEEPVNWSRPSIDVLFESAAQVFGARLMAVLLTGASADGAAGLAAVARAGGTTVVQDPATATFDTMPRAAVARLVPDHVEDLAAIAARFGALAGAAGGVA